MAAMAAKPTNPETNGLVDEGYTKDPEKLHNQPEALFVNDEKLLRAPSHVAQGTWWDAAWHMGTAVPTPAAVFPLSYALSRMGWTAGILGLVAGGAVTFYTSCVLASLNNFNGARHARYRDLAYEVWGATGAYVVLTLQLAVNIGSLITIGIGAGEGLKFLYQLYHPDEGPSLAVWIIVFQAFQVLLGMLPDLHSLRSVNFLSTICVIIMSTVAFGLTIYDGNMQDRSQVSYSVGGTVAQKAFSVFNAMATISLAYGNTMLPEIQATVREPVVLNMHKAIAGSYVIIIAAYFGVGIAGYWAYGFGVGSYLLFSLTSPVWCVFLANLAAVLQFAASYMFYCQLSFEYMETRYGDPTKPTYSLRNFIPRFILRTTFTALITLVCCMLPFFGDFVALVGAIGFTPMDFVLPIFLYLEVKRVIGWRYWANLTVAVFYILVGVCGCIGAIRSIIVDATNYQVFANLEV